MGIDISKVDKNFAQPAFDVKDGMKYYPIPCAPFELYGVFHDGEGFVRMPREVASEVSEGVAILNAHTAGGRLRFTTDSEYMELVVRFDLSLMRHMALSGSAGFSLLRENEDGSCAFAAGFYPIPGQDLNGFTCRLRIGNGKDMQHYVLHFPLYNNVYSLTVGLDEGATVKPGLPYRDELPILYYGSSITQGGCASRPDNAYQAYISKWTNTDFINLGFSGNAKAEDRMAEYLENIQCSIFVYDYDHNAPNAEHLEKTHERFFLHFRKHHPNVPVVMVSKPDFDMYPAADAKRRAVIKKTYRNAKKNGDENVYFVDGQKLFGKEDRENCYVDGCHPTDLGFYRMAKEIYKVIKKLI